MWSIELNYTGALFGDAKEKARANAVADERKKKKMTMGYTMIMTILRDYVKTTFSFLPNLALAR